MAINKFGKVGTTKVNNTRSFANLTDSLNDKLRQTTTTVTVANFPSGKQPHTAYPIKPVTTFTNIPVLPPPPVDLRLTSINDFVVESNTNPTTITAIHEPSIETDESGIISYETLFNEFNIGAYPFYNFWTEDELTNDADARGDRKLEDVPRFIKVVWNKPPNLPNLMGFREPADKKNRGGTGIILGHNNEKPVVVTVGGVEFAPDHLQPISSLPVWSLSNGYVGPGVINSIAELPLHNTSLDSYKTFEQSDKIHHPDEDLFLVNPDLQGVSIHELILNVNQMTNGALGANSILTAPMSSDSKRECDSFFNGNFSACKSPYNGGDFQLCGVNSYSGASLSQQFKTCESSEKIYFDQVIDKINVIVESPATTNIRKSKYIKIAFKDTAIGGAVSEEKVAMMTKPEHAESIIAIAQALPGLEVMSRSGVADKALFLEIPSYESPAGLPPLEYVGYVLEKYKKTTGGSFQLVETIELPSIEYNEYYDCKVVYGGVYRYRVRTIIRWTRPSFIGPNGTDPLSIGQNGSAAGSTAQYKSSYFGSEWSENWVYGAVIDLAPPPPPDEFNVRSESYRNRIIITCKLPHNPQRDISAIQILRKLQTVSGFDLTDWIPIGPQFGPQNVLYIDNDVAVNKNGKPEPGIRYVYTAVCISKHWEHSVLSEQLGIRLNPDHIAYGEYKTDFVSCAGVRMNNVGAFATYPFRKFRSEIILSPEIRRLNESEKYVDFMFSGRERKGNSMLDDADYVIRIESLDTGEKNDIPLTIRYDNKKDRYMPPKTQNFISSNAKDK